MVQREVADRFFAAPARRPTAPSRCSCSSQPSAPASIRSRARSSGRRRTSTPRSSRSAGSPLPEDFARDQARRRGGVRAPAQDAARTRSSSPASRPRARAAAALDRDRPRPRRPGRGARAGRVRRAHRLRCDEVARRPGEDQSRARRRPGPAGREARGRDRAPADRPRRPRSRSSRARTSRSTASPEDTLVRDALRALAAEAAASSRAGGATIEKRIPVAAGLGGGSSDAATALRLANDTLRRSARRPNGCTRLAAALGADVPFFLAQGRSSAPVTARSSRRSSCRRTTGSSCCSRRARRSRRRRPSTPRSTPRRSAASTTPRRARSSRSPVEARARPRRAAAATTSPPRRSRRSSSALGAFRADVTGAGPAVYGLFADRRASRRRPPSSAPTAARPG